VSSEQCDPGSGGAPIGLEVNSFITITYGVPARSVSTNLRKTMNASDLDTDGLRQPTRFPVEGCKPLRLKEGLWEDARPFSTGSGPSAATALRRGPDCAWLKLANPLFKAIRVPLGEDLHVFGVVTTPFIPCAESWRDLWAHRLQQLLCLLRACLPNRS
jgi:hypothetical protein